MISVHEVKRVCLVHSTIDFRKQHDGLLGESYKAGLKPYEGDLVVFANRRNNSIKMLLFDGSGLWVLYKKFKTGNLRRQFRFLADPAVSFISFGEVSLLLEGACYTVHE